MQSDLTPIRVLGVLEVWTVVLMTSFRIRWVADEQKDRVVIQLPGNNTPQPMSGYWRGESVR